MSIRETSALVLFCLGMVGASCKAHEKAVVMQNVVHDKKTYQTGVVVREFTNSSDVEYSNTSGYYKNKFTNLIQFVQIKTLEGIYTALVKPYEDKKVKDFELKQGDEIRFVTNDPDRAGKEFNENKVGKIYYDQIEILEKK